MTNLFTVAKTYPLTGVSLPENRNNNGIITSPRHVFTYIEETGEPLGVVSPDYQIMQPQECYDLVEATCGNVENVRWDGKTMIMQGKMNSMLLPGDDEVNNMFTIINSFDGSSALYGMAISFRMFCSNQLRSALSEGKANNSRNSIRHSGDWDTKLTEFRTAFTKLRSELGQFEYCLGLLAKKKVTSQEIETLWKTVATEVCNISRKDLDTTAAASKISSFVSYCTNTYETERDLGCPDSMWLAANAVTKYIQHNVGSRGRKPNQDRRYIDNAIGGRANLSARVMSQALKMV